MVMNPALPRGNGEIEMTSVHHRACAYLSKAVTSRCTFLHSVTTVVLSNDKGSTSNLIAPVFGLTSLELISLAGYVLHISFNIFAGTVSISSVL